MSHDTTTNDGTELKTIPDLRRKQVEQTSCITLSYCRDISHLSKGYPQQRVSDHVSRILYDWVNCFEETGRMEVDVSTKQDGDQWISVEETVILPDTDDDTLDRALAVTQIAEDAMRAAVKEQE